MSALRQDNSITLSRLLPWFILIGLCGNITYFLFPFPAGIWRGFLTLVFLSTIWVSRKLKWSNLEKAISTFLVINWIYYTCHILNTNDDGVTHIISISIALLSFIALSRLGRRHLVKSHFITISAISIVCLGIAYYYNSQLLLQKQYSVEDITINASVVFLFSLPFMFFIRKKVIPLALLMICLYFILISAKRGNILAASIPIVLYAYSLLKKTRKNLIAFFVLAIVFIFAVNWFSEIITQDKYLMMRLNNTIEGNSSGRDIIYSELWDFWSNSTNPLNLFFGYGWQATINATQNHKLAHCDWLEALVDYGLIGLIIYASIFWFIFKNITQTKDLNSRLCLISILIIWLFKATYSMAFSEEYLSIMSLPFGYAIQKSQTRKFHDNPLHN